MKIKECNLSVFTSLRDWHAKFANKSETDKDEFESNATEMCELTATATYGGPYKSSHTTSVVQIIFSFWSFKISEGILRN